MPESYLTWTRGRTPSASPRSAADSAELGPPHRDIEPAASATSSSARVSAPMVRIRASGSARASSVASAAAATASQLAPPASAARAHSHRAVTVSVRLDHGAEPSVAAELADAAARQLRSTAASSTTATARCDGARRSCRERRRESAAITSVAITDSAEPSRSAAILPARCVRVARRRTRPRRAPCRGRAARRSSPRARHRVPAVASAGAAAAADRQPLPVGDERVVALEHDDRAAALGCLARAGKPMLADLGRVAPEQPAQLAGVGRQHGRGFARRERLRAARRGR